MPWIAIHIDYGDYGDEIDIDSEIGVVDSNLIKYGQNQIMFCVIYKLNHHTTLEAVCSIPSVNNARERSIAHGSFDELVRDFACLTLQSGMSNSEYKKCVYFFFLYLMCEMILIR